MTRVLSILAAFASPVFLCAAIAGWLYDVWPATPVTFGAAAFLVVGGPILGIVHMATSKEGLDEEEEAVTEVLTAPVLVHHAAPIPARRPIVMTPQAEAAARFAAWRDSPNQAIALRERERRASRYARS